MSLIVRVALALLIIVAAATILAGGLGRVPGAEHSPYASALSNAAIGDAYARHFPGGGSCADMTCNVTGSCYHYTGAGTDCYGVYGGGCETGACQ